MRAAQRIALEEAAKVCEEMGTFEGVPRPGVYCAAAIRQLET